MKIITFKSNSNIVFPKKYYIYEDQISILSKLYFNIDFDYRNDISKVLKNKLNNYIQQDKKRKRDFSNNITYEESIYKLLTSKLKCYYCKNNVKIIYKEIKDKNQWTFDRLNNNISHTNNNVVVCCLECNLKRGIQNYNDFLFGKQLQIIKRI